LMAAKRTSHDDDSTKNLHVPSTKRIKHHDDIFAFSIVHSLRKVVVVSHSLFHAFLPYFKLL
jgi:hypothetical protein